MMGIVDEMLGEVTPRMRIVTIDAAPGEASDELRQDLDAAMTEIFAEFTGDSELPDVAFILGRRDEPGPLIQGRPIFARKGRGVYHAEHAHLYAR